MSAERPDRPEPRRLGEDQGMPGDFLVGFTDRLMDRRQQLLRQGQPPQTARELAVAEAIQAFHAGADERGWTVDNRRIATLAGDALGLEDEYRDRHGYEPELARLWAVGEVLEGERAREEIPLPWRQATHLSGPDPARRQRPVSERTPPDGRADSVRTREAGGER
ncbi:MAG TPA: hypothetical protein VF880_13130 [Actinomycetes bacterium]